MTTSETRPTLRNPIGEFLKHKDVIFLDGALATELQVRGCNIDGALWSGRALSEDPDLIRQVHLDYFKAGANIAITASYQTSLRGLEEQGYSREDAIQLIKKSAELAKDARWEFETTSGLGGGLVAGSIGPYGAFLADGSEYTGDYQLPPKEMMSFHRSRMRELLDAGVDVLAIETIPSFPETHALLTVLEEFPTATAWFTFTMKDNMHISDGTALDKVMRSINRSKQVIAVGVNCIAMDRVTAVLAEMTKLTNKPLVAYPNSGQIYDVASNSWSGEKASREALSELVLEWRKLGARLIGGCCQTGPEDIKAIVAAFEPPKSRVRGISLNRPRGLSLKGLIKPVPEKLHES